MDPISRRAKEVFVSLLDDVPEDERERRADEACRGDEPLRQRVQALLLAHAKPDSRLDRLAIELSPTPDGPEPGREEPGSTIGPYKLREQIGEGGFGVVYVAQQEKPVSRKVALKIIKPGMDTKEVIARFEAERQALAIMEHPNVARVLDAGATESGRPFFVMELVRGVPITEFSDERRLSNRERLSMFLDVCRGVQHAHQKGIIHRDLKPGNVMVTISDGRPLPKIIDFGVSKALSQKLTDKTVYTAYGQMVGTPMYMSPEQAELTIHDVDTRSDVYSLGVLLYELLTGTTPFDRETLQKSGFDEMRRIIREEEPPRPSARISTLGNELTTIAQQRSIEPRKLQQSVRGDLDWIVMKCLEKDRSRRYQSATDLARDVERFLQHEPVQARRPTVTDWVTKWTRRHQTVVRAGVAVLAFVALASLVSASFIVRERDAAIHERDVARENLYFADIRLAQQDWEAGNVARMLELLDAHRPEPGEPDLRGWEWYYLYSLPHRNNRTFYGHAGPVLCVDWSPDGLRLASGSTDGTVKVWDVATGHQLLTLRGHEAPVRSVSWAPDGRRLASGGGSLVRWDGEGKRRATEADHHNVIIWDTQRAERIKTLTFQVDAFAMQVPVAWSPNGRLLACGTHRIVRVWETENWQPVFASADRPHMVATLAWRPDGKRLAWSDTWGNAHVWNAETQQEHPLFVWGNGVKSLVWSPDGREIAASSAYETIAICKLDDVTTVPRKFHGPGGSINSLDWSPVNDRIASCSHNGMLKIRDPASGDAMLTLRGHKGWVHCVDWSPDGRRLASAGDDGTVRVWETSPQDSTRLAGTERCDWHPDGRRLAVAAPERRVMVLDGISGEELFTFREAFQRRFVTGVAWSSDGGRLAAAGGDGTVRVWDATTRAQLFMLRTDLPNMYETRALSWSPDDRFIATGGMDQVVVIWDAASGAEVFRLEGHEATIGSVVWSPDGRQIASASWDQVVKIWDVATRQERLHILRDESFNRGTSNTGTTADSQYSVLWSADGSRLYTGNAHGEISVWDVTTGAELMRLRGHPATVRGLALGSGGRRLASAANDGVIRIWDLRTGRELLALPIEGVGRSVDWSPDGRRLVSSGNSVCVWDASFGYEMERQRNE